MATKTNRDKMLQAVLSNEDLRKFGNYTLTEVSTLYKALDSDNFVINSVAQIIKRIDEDASKSGLWKEINDYLKKNV